MRPVEDWADKVYTVLADVHHIKPFGDGSALCGLYDTTWFGTGDFDEIDTAQTLPMCRHCNRQLHPRDPAVTDWEEALRAQA